MQDSKHDPVLASKIWGVLAEVINVPADFEAAIEYALGGAMQNVLVETERDASDLINYLKQRVTDALPSDRSRPAVLVRLRVRTGAYSPSRAATDLQATSSNTTRNSTDSYKRFWAVRLS